MYGRAPKSAYNPRMAKEYIAKALIRLSKAGDHGADLCDSVANVLNGMTSYRVNSLNRDLNFMFVSARMGRDDLEGEEQEDVLDLRRAAKMLASTLPLPPDATADQADAWSNSALRTFVAKYAAAYNQYRPAGTQYCLKGSFWGFADHAERSWMRVAWIETCRMLGYGVTAVRLARGNDPTADGLVTRWFGNSNQVTIEGRLRRIVDGMLSERTGVCYLGPGLRAAGGYREMGPHQHAH